MYMYMNFLNQRLTVLIPSVLQKENPYTKNMDLSKLMDLYFMEQSQYLNLLSNNNGIL